MLPLKIKKLVTLSAAFVLLIFAHSVSQARDSMHHHPPALPYDPQISQVELTEAQWKELLPQDVYKILRKKGTERAFTGKYDKHYEHGEYICAGCGQPLFSSETKFDSGTGWPSFYQPVDTKAVAEKSDRSLLFMPRTEILCGRCGGHLGHVFKDGPKPTGLRYCINSLALTFKPFEHGKQEP